MAAFIAAIIGGFNQVRGAILGGVILGVLDNLSAAYLSSQYRGGVSADHPDRRHPVAPAGPARPDRGAHGMNRARRHRPSSLPLSAAIAAPFFLKPYRHFPDFDLGGPHHRRHRPQSDARLCRADVAGAGRFRRHRRLYGGAADAGGRAVFRWRFSPPAFCASPSAGDSAIRRCGCSTIISPSSRWLSPRSFSWCCATRSG